MIKFNSILTFIIHLSTIYINPMFTVYLINEGWGCFGEDTCVWACINLMLLGCQKLEKLFYENKLRKFLLGMNHINVSKYQNY